MTFAATKTWTTEVLTSTDLNNTIGEIETELNAFPTDGALASGCVSTTQLATNAVTNAKMADDSVDEDEIVDGAVTADKIGTGAVTNAKLGATSVTYDKLSTVFGTSTLNDAAASAIALNETYLASGDGLAITYFTTSTGTTITAYSDSDSTPTTTIWTGFLHKYSCACVTPIQKNHYFKLDGNANYAANVITRWFPFGSGTLTKQ